MERTRFLSLAGMGALAACTSGNNPASQSGLLIPSRKIARPNWTVCNNSYGIYGGKYIWEITDCGIGLVFSATLADGVLSGWYVDQNDVEHTVSMKLAQWNNGPPAQMQPDDLHKLTYDGVTVTLLRRANGNKIMDGSYSGQSMALYDYTNNQQHQENWYYHFNNNVGGQCQIDIENYLLYLAVFLAGIALSETPLGWIATAAALAQMVIAYQQMNLDCPQ